jgi:MFS family permease
MLTFFLGEILSITCSPLFADIFSMRQIFGSLISATMIGYIICVFVPNSTSMTLGLFLRGFGYGGIAYYRYILVKITAIETIPLSLMILLYVNAS